MTLPDIIENYENAAERQLDKMTEGLPAGKFRCDCGEIDDLAHASSASENPYSPPICRKCLQQAISNCKVKK
jgi:hypothetical protein